MNPRRRRLIQALLGMPLAARLPVARGQDGRSYAAVSRDIPVEFPADHAAHPDYAVEWWYFTGFLRVPRTGAQRTFEVTFFRSHPDPGPWLDNPSAFTPRQVLSAHAALGDPQVREFRYWRRMARLGLDGGRVADDRLDVAVRDWRLRQASQGRWHLALAGEPGEWDLWLRPTGIAVRHGTNGISPKNADGSVSSYYYSYPAMAVSGHLPMDGHMQRVEGEAWFDHEWTSTFLPGGTTGWDWVGLRFDDGSALMAYRFRASDGGTAYAAGTWITAQRSAGHLYAEEMEWRALRHWRSPDTGYDYPVAWEIRAGGRTLRVEALFDAQEMVGSGPFNPTYWEGAVEVSGDRSGRGFLEMTRLEG